MIKERSDVLRALLSKDMKGLEIGALYHPVVPKAEGWNALSVDHDSKEGLLAAYSHDVNATSERIQSVDVVWNGGSLSDALVHSGHQPAEFDYVVASHVIEHFPDMLGALRDFAVVMKEGGIVSLAIPDLRYCFDFFMPWSTTAEILTAHEEKRVRHTKGSIFRMFAYRTTGIVNRGLPDELVSAYNIELSSDIKHAYDQFVDHESTWPSRYADTHAWYFTPSSFRLVMLELRALQLVHFDIESSERGPCGEFLVSMRKTSTPLSTPRDQLKAQRMDLLKETTRELAHRANMLDVPRL
ncbi:methyltransferase domain-containing protein [Paraburkholderia largidicola]|uniref:Uncharacterized protein n=1 Tax=Paraburkholderia largidicola TaxID=3014751 RepID=A0A7I8BLV4_9BURK|nr:methyltransferase domain-containing protein [Paraburkholderia sp. PGU16]BCF89413.1 hypothetical protein PPGU16_24800 [Paraburkholderia sp. PGU16]